MIEDGAPQSILVIDDDPAIHDLVDARLRAEAVSLRHASDVDSALAMARAAVPDLFLLDLDLNGQSGIDLCKQLKADPDLAMVPVIFLTGTVSVETKVQAFDAGAIDYVTKPFDGIELRARVRAALRTKRYQDLLATRARLDGLTGLWNRAYFDRVLEDEVSLWARHARPLSVVMIDVDHFKSINDRHGHPFGDHVLLRVAEALRAATRRGETACRYGGEEFAVLLRETDLAGAEAVAERLRAAIEAIDVRRGAERVPVTASVGYASSESVATGGELTPSAILDAADRGLYEAKRSGRNCARSSSARTASS